MPLNLTVNDGDFTPYLKYNAKAGRFYAKPEGGTEVEIITPLLAFDMANIRTGWLFYADGAPPEKVWDPSLSQQAARPPGTQKWKRGFEVQVYGNGLIPGTQQRIGVREFSSTAGNVIGPMLRMYAEYEAGIAQNKDHVPVFGCEGVKPINGQHGVNYEPLFVLKTWIARIKIPEFDAQSPQTNMGPASNGGGNYDELNPPPHDSVPARAGSMKDQLNDPFFG